MLVPVTNPTSAAVILFRTPAAEPKVPFEFESYMGPLLSLLLI